MSPTALLLLALGPTLPPPAPPPAVLLSPGPGATLTADPPFQPPTDRLTGCPTAHRQPFLRQPDVQPVPPCTPAAGGGGCKAWNLWAHEFPHAAHVPLPRFDLCGGRVDSDGLLIYEGMRLTVDRETGVFDLEFTATVPETPVTLRLQLVFASEFRPLDPAYRITLPPMRMEPDRDARPGQPSHYTFRVHHRGQSERFRQTRSGVVANGYVDATGGGWKVSRVGTARFGTPVAQDDQYR